MKIQSILAVISLLVSFSNGKAIEDSTNNFQAGLTEQIKRDEDHSKST